MLRVEDTVGVRPPRIALTFGAMACDKFAGANAH
jgi:hypothetical protein